MTSHRIGTLAPRRTRYVVLYWDKAIFCKTAKQRDEALGSLNYYQAEDARVISATAYRKH